MLIHEIVGGDFAFCGVVDAPEVFRRGKPLAMPIFVNSLLVPDSRGTGELSRRHFLGFQPIVEFHGSER
jgi:hypothetical protein